MSNLLPKRFNARERESFFWGIKNSREGFFAVLLLHYESTPGKTAGFIHRDLTLRGINRPTYPLAYQKNFRDDIFRSVFGPLKKSLEEAELGGILWPRGKAPV